MIRINIDITAGYNYRNVFFFGVSSVATYTIYV